MRDAAIEVEEVAGGFAVRALGAWTISSGLGRVDATMRKLEALSLDKKLSIDLANVDRMDTAGAMVLQRLMRACGARRADAESLRSYDGLSPRYAELLKQAQRHMVPCDVEGPQRQSFLLMLDRVGAGTIAVGKDTLSILSFVGAVIARLGATLKNPGRFRITPTVHHMEEAGLDATLIVGMMSFLIGAVVAFMGARVLAEFGAEVFSVELVGISVLREFGVLLMAILVAGRSGSAFTAAIGSMKLREEIDAMEAMGINPLDALVLPRVIALIITLPALAFLAAFLGLLGGGLVGWLALDIPPQLFVSRTQEIVVLSNFWVGIVKAPFFAFVIAVVGCYHGMQVRSSAEELGRRTTMAVVQSLFLVILINALFAMVFLELDV